jgi:hypothetical protein
VLVLDWLAPHTFRSWPTVYYLFDCGPVPESLIRPSPDEVRAHAFVPLQAATPLVTPATMRRLTAAATARATSQTTYLADPRTP